MSTKGNSSLLSEQTVAGKTTLLKTVSGVMRPWSGTVSFLDKRIDTTHANDIVDMGLSHIPESRKLFTDMSIRENLEMGAYPKRSWKERQDTMKWVFELFPVSRNARISCLAH